MSNMQIVDELKITFQNKFLDPDSFYNLIEQLFVNEGYNNQDFVLEQMERFYHEADFHWPRDFALMTSALVNCSNKSAKILGRKLLDELYDQCRESLEALNGLVSEIERDIKMRDNPDMQSFFKKVLDSVELSEEEYTKIDQILSHESVSADNRSIEKAQRYNLYADLQFRHKDYESAKMDMIEATKYDPENSILWGRAGFAAKKNGNLFESIKYYSKAVELDPLYTTGFGNLGWINLKLRNYEESAKYYKRVLVINPDSFLAASHLSELYFLQRDVDNCKYYMQVFDEILDDMDLRFMSEKTKETIERTMTDHCKYRTYFKSIQEN